MEITYIPTPKEKAHIKQFDELFDSYSQDWEYKARRLKARRWRAMKRKL